MPLDPDPEYLVALFPSITQVMRSERLLIERRIAHQLVPTPRRLSSECGVSIRFLAADRDPVVQALGGRTTLLDIRPMP
jgi:hypothetical protein